MTGPLAGGVYLAAIIAVSASIGWLIHDHWQRHHTTPARPQLRVLAGGADRSHVRTINTRPYDQDTAS